MNKVGASNTVSHPLPQHRCAVCPSAADVSRPVDRCAPCHPHPNGARQHHDVRVHQREAMGRQLHPREAVLPALSPQLLPIFLPAGDGRVGEHVQHIRPCAHSGGRLRHFVWSTVCCEFVWFVVSHQRVFYVSVLLVVDCVIEGATTAVCCSRCLGEAVELSSACHSAARWTWRARLRFFYLECGKRFCACFVLPYITYCTLGRLSSPLPS